MLNKYLHPQFENNRTNQEVIQHYELEKFLANKLRNANKEERAILYKSVYNELFLSLPHHPQLSTSKIDKNRIRDIEEQISFIKKFLPKSGDFLEVGSGDCAIVEKIESWANHVYATDVSEEIAQKKSNNKYTLFITNGVENPKLPSLVDVVYSNQVMEHLHPEDAIEQINWIFKILKKDGYYICSTPNKLTGPHDISMHFDESSTGLHLKEYKLTELFNIFKKANFKSIKFYSSIKGFRIRLYYPFIWTTEVMASFFSKKLRLLFFTKLPFRLILNAAIVAKKSSNN